MQYAITFLEGIITFVSPCLLPLLPVYVAFFAGGVSGQDETTSIDASGAGEGASGDAVRLRQTAVSALGFILGFTILFVAMGAFAGTVGSFFLQHQAALNVVCGIIVIVMGLNFMGVFKIPLLEKTFRMDFQQEGHGFFASALFGIVFAIGWTPCVGAFLASALSLAASTGSTMQGIALLTCYSLGLGVPFFLAAILIDRLENAFNWVKRHYTPINIASGAVLVIVGVLMATGRLGLWLSALSVL